ncbi:MAG: GreA/GreB family elongation factor [Simkaniaceae bacterium]|nr:GreA/GreB family elongation factor [Simkaniaceae bacterium]
MMEYFKQFSKHIDRNDLQSIASLWEEYCLSDEVELDEVIKILNSIQASHIGEAFSSCVDQFLPLWETLPDTKKSREIFRLIIDMTNSKEHALRQKVFDKLKEWYGENARFDWKIKLSGLNNPDTFRYAVSRFELLTHMEVGNFVYHTAGWGVGEIMDVSAVREQISCEFDFVAGQKDLSFTNAFKTLIPLPKDHFLSQRFGNPDALEDKARVNPVEVIRTLLRDLGPKTAGEIKDELADLVIPEEEWSKWWQTARSKLKKDTLIEIPSSIRQPFKLRESELSHEERLQDALKKKPGVKQLIELVYSFLRDFASTLKNEDFRQSLATHLQEVLQHEELTDSQELEIHFFLETLLPNKTHTPVVELVKRFHNIEDVLERIEIIAHKKRALSEVKAHRDDWVAIFGSLIFKLSQIPLKDYMFDQLMKAKEQVSFSQEVDKMLIEPWSSPHTLLWYFHKIMHETNIPFSNQEGKNRFLEAFFALFHFMEQSERGRDMVKKMYTMLTNGRFAWVRQIFQDADKKSVQEFLLLATKCSSLSEHDIKILHSLAEVVHPSLSRLNTHYSDEDQEDVVWTTDEGYKKLQQRIHEIGTVETVENAREIEVARSHGDLKENSEYKYALEKRAQLQAELKRLSDLLGSMRILTAEDVNTDVVGVGSIVELKNGSGEEKKFTLLGPWDADLEKNILSFQSKLAKSLEGKRLGESCHFDQKDWEIKSISNYFDKVS